MTARKMWNGIRGNGKLPPEWETWAEFRAWVNANNYKAKYGYKGEFTPDSLLKAIPNNKATSVKKESKPNNSEYDFDTLMRLKLDELKELATENEIDIGEATTKREIATLICGGN